MKKTAEFLHNFFGKGRMVVVNGRIQTRSWEDKAGNKRKATEVVADRVYFGDTKKQNEDTGVRDSYPMQNSFEELDEDDGNLPF